MDNTYLKSSLCVCVYMCVSFVEYVCMCNCAPYTILAAGLLGKRLDIHRIIFVRLATYRELMPLVICHSRVCILYVDIS